MVSWPTVAASTSEAKGLGLSWHKIIWNTSSGSYTQYRIKFLVSRKWVIQQNAYDLGLVTITPTCKVQLLGQRKYLHRWYVYSYRCTVIHFIPGTLTYIIQLFLSYFFHRTDDMWKSHTTRTLSSGSVVFILKGVRKPTCIMQILCQIISKTEPLRPGSFTQWHQLNSYKSYFWACIAAAT